MPLSDSYPILQAEIEIAFKKLRDNAKKAAKGDKDNSDEVIAQVSHDLAAAIHSYVLSAVVITTGVSVVTGVAGPLAPVGACPIVGAGVTSGQGNLI